MRTRVENREVKLRNEIKKQNKHTNNNVEYIHIYIDKINRYSTHMFLNSDIYTCII